MCVCVCACVQSGRTMPESWYGRLTSASGTPWSSSQETDYCTRYTDLYTKTQTHARMHGGPLIHAHRCMLLGPPTHACIWVHTHMLVGPHTHACGSTHTHPKACMDKQSHTRWVTFYYSFILTKPGKAHFSIKCSISCLFFSCPYMNELPLCHCISSFKK